MVLPLTFRTLALISVLFVIAGLYFVWTSSREKKDYDHVTGHITYLDKHLGNLPFSDPGDYRYIQIESYNYPFEVYTAEQGPKVDSLRVGDIVTVYYYENNFTYRDHINRFLQFLDKDSRSYYKRSNIGKITGWFIIAGGILLAGLGYFLYQRKKIVY